MEVDDDREDEEDDGKETLLDHLLSSAWNDIPLFQSWEPRRIHQLYFLTRNEDGQQAENWLDHTMNYFFTRVLVTNPCISTST